jgi:general secretion pathway protein B
MSFILEALKKSEQQRQQQKSSQQEVRKRTLALPARRQGRWTYWVVAGFLSVVLLCSWWFYGKTEPDLVQDAVVTRSTNITASLSQAERLDSVEHPLVTGVAQSTVAVVEPAPVPRDVVSSPPVQVNTTADENVAPAFTAESAVKNDEPVVTVVVEQQEPRDIDKLSFVKLPLYLDLSKEMRDQMPRLAMSMHYYIADPARRMVRINNLLLHEGDWVSNDLQIVEITHTGATLDFLGKLFEMRRSTR